jgi:hypothetical protein
MTTTVQLPDGSTAEFPDGMTPEQISEALSGGNKPSTMWDMAKHSAAQFGSGVVEGTSALVGMPKDISSLMMRPVYWAESKITGQPYQEVKDYRESIPRPETFIPDAPDGRSLTNAFEKYVTPLPEPQSTSDEYIRTLGSFAPAAIGSAPSLLARAARVAAPAVTSETAGQVARKVAPEYEPYARFAGALGGGAGAMLAAKAAAPAIPGVGRTASNMMTSAARQSGDKLSQVSQMGDDAMLLNTTQPMKGLTQGVVTKGGEGAQRIEDALKVQREAFPQRAKAMLDETFGPSVDAEIARRALVEERSAITRSLYKAADDAGFQAPVGPQSDTMMNLSSKLVKVSEGFTKSDRKGWETLMENVDDALNSGNPTLIAKRLRNIRVELDDSINYKGVGSQPSSYSNISNSAKVEARRAIDAELKSNVPGLKEADEAFSGYSTKIDHVTKGEQASVPVMNPDVLRQELSKMTPVQREAFKIGDRSSLEREFGTRANELLALRKRLGADGLDWQRQNVETIYGADAAKKGGKFLDVETSKAKDFNDFLGNSKTAVRQEFAGKFDNTVKDIPLDANSVGMALRATGVNKFYKSLYSMLVRSGSKTAQDDIAKALTLTGRQRDEFVTELLKRANAPASTPSDIAKAGYLGSQNQEPRRDRNGRKIRKN